MYTVRRAGVVLSLSEATLKSIILISHDPELIADTRELCKTRGMALTVETEWKRALLRTLFEAADHREIPYWYGDHRCRAKWVGGRPAHRS